MSRYALVDGNNVVQNVVRWDGITPGLFPGLAAFLVPDNLDVAPGYTKAGATYTRGVTQAELDAQALGDLRAKGVQALTNNDQYLAIGSPTQAQAIAQVGALTRQVDALIRLGLNITDTTGDT